MIRSVRQQQAKPALFFQSGRKGTNALNRTVLPKCPCFLRRVAACRLEAPDTHSSHSNHTSIGWIQWLGKRQRSGALRALGGLQCHDDMHKLGHWEKRARLWKPRCLHGDHCVDTAITSSSRQIRHDKKAACSIVCRMDNKILSKRG